MIDVILTLAAQLQPHMIESILAKSDIEVAFDVLTGKIHLPGRVVPSSVGAVGGAGPASRQRDLRLRVIVAKVDPNLTSAHSVWSRWPGPSR